MLATKAALASGGITHCCLRCGLRMFFFSVLPIVLSLARSTMCSSTTFSRAGAGSNGRNPPGPGEGERDQFCFCCAVENPRPGGIGIVFAPQHRLEPLLDHLAPGPLDSGDAGVQRRGNPAVAQPSPSSDTSAFSRIRAFVSSWRNACLCGSTRRVGRVLPRSTALRTS